MNINRRLALIGTTALAACTSTGTLTTSVITTAETDLLLIVNSAIQIAGTLRPVNPTLAASLTDGSTKPLDLARAGLMALLAGTPPPIGATTPAQIIGILSTALTTLAPVVGIAIPGSMPFVIAAQVLLATASTLLGAPVAAPAPARIGARIIPVPSEDEARARLKFLTGTK